MSKSAMKNDRWESSVVLQLGFFLNFIQRQGPAYEVITVRKRH